MPALIPAAAGASAIGTAAIGGATLGAGAALGTGLAAGAALAGGAGLLGNLGLSAIGAPALGGLAGAAAPAALSNIAPAALAQATQTIAPSVLQSAGLDALKTNVIGGGVQQAAGQGLASALPSAYNPAMAQNLGAQFMANSPPLAKPFGAETMLADVSNKVAPNVIQQTPDLATQLQTAQLKGAGASQLPADTAAMSNIRPDQNFFQNLGNISSFQDVQDYVEQHPYASAAGAYGLYKALQPKYESPKQTPGMIRPYDFDYNPTGAASEPYSGSGERTYFNPVFTAQTPYEAPGPEYKKASGGLTSLAVGGPVEQMAAMNAVGANTGYPMVNINTPVYANPMVQRPEATNVVAPSADAGVGAYTGEARFAFGGSTSGRDVLIGPNMRASDMGVESFGGRGRSSGGAQPQYTYDPNTQQFTQVNAPSRSALSNFFNRGQTQGAPASTAVSGGIAAPIVPAAPSAQTQQPTPINIPAYQTPEQQLGLGGFYDYMNQQLGGYAGYAAGGGVAHLGDYSDGGRLLKGPGDGVSDSIPAVIGERQPARLADGEFVVPARIVSELGNGSTEAGARKLYAMMDRVQKARKKSVGSNKVAVNSKADKHLPA